MPKVNTRSRRKSSEKPYTNIVLRNSRRSTKSTRTEMDSQPDSVEEEGNETLVHLSDDERQSTPTDVDKSPTNRELLQYLKQMDKRQCTKSDLKAINDTLTKNIGKVETKANVNELAIDELKQRLTHIEAQQASAHYDNELSKQKQLRNNISIMGLPHIRDEITAEVASDVFAHLNCKIVSKNIEYAYRTKASKENPGIIIVRLKNYEHKMEILDAKAKKTVKVRDVATCEGPIGNQYIYVNNHVTPFFGKLLFDGRQAIKNGNAFSCWFTSAGCNIKFNEDGKSYIYKSTAEMNALIDKYGTKSSINNVTDQRAATVAPSSSKPKGRQRKELSIQAPPQRTTTTKKK